MFQLLRFSLLTMTYLVFLAVFVSTTTGAPQCPLADSAGEHHFPALGGSKTIHIHQPFYDTAAPMNWDQAQAFCNQTYNNSTYSGGRLWEPASASEYTSVQAEMVLHYPNTGIACEWWIGVRAPGTVAPRPASYASDGNLISWHQVTSVGGPSEDGSYSGPCVTIDDDYDEWRAENCDYYRHNWICESFKTQEEAKCTTKDPCKNAFPDSTLDGFCSKVSWFGGDCIGYGPTGVPLCPQYQNGFPLSIPGQSCTCCKECLDISCTDKGPGWSCVNYNTSMTYPKGTCKYDDTCKLPKLADNLKQCACCYDEHSSTSTSTTTATTTTNDPQTDCVDNGCNESLNGLGECVSLHDADWEMLNFHYNLSYPTSSGLCIDQVSGSADCCKCVMKRPCMDDGCQDYWQGHGICLQTSILNFASLADEVDFSAGGQDDLCTQNSGCCTCFKKKTSWPKSCCDFKTVGSIKYKLVDYDSDIGVSMGCSSGCLYEDHNGKKFCFASGNEKVSCDQK